MAFELKLRTLLRDCTVSVKGHCFDSVKSHKIGRDVRVSVFPIPLT